MSPEVKEISSCMAIYFILAIPACLAVYFNADWIVRNFVL